jgi:hypothetical protein
MTAWRRELADYLDLDFDARYQLGNAGGPGDTIGDHQLPI